MTTGLITLILFFKRKKSGQENALIVFMGQWCSDGMEATWPMFGFCYGQDIFLLHSIQTGSGASPASCPSDTGSALLGNKVAGV
jgi:hypothetical protein